MTDGTDSAQTLFFAIFLKNLTNCLQVSVQLILSILWFFSAVWPPVRELLQVDLEHLMAAQFMYFIQGSLAAL